MNILKKDLIYYLNVMQRGVENIVVGDNAASVNDSTGTEA